MFSRICLTTSLKAVLRFAEDGCQPRIYTAGELGVNTAQYYAHAAPGIGLPWSRETRIYWPRIGKLARQLRAFGTDVVHVTTPGPIGLAGRWLARQLDVPIVGTYHTPFGDSAAALSRSPRLARCVARYVRWYYDACDPVLVPSEATRSLLHTGGYRTTRVRLWARGVDAERFSPERASTTLRDAWHVDHRRPAVLYVGRLAREKGLALVEPLQRHLHRHGLQHRLIFVGDGPMRSELMARCPDGAFLGSVPHDRVAEAMASADVFLFPSATETLGNVVLEAQAAGLPVVVSDEGGAHQHIVPGVTGVVAAAGRAEAFAAALVPLLRDRALRHRMGAAARAHAATRDWPRALAPLFAAWRTAAAHHSRRDRRAPVVDRPPAAAQHDSVG